MSKDSIPEEPEFHLAHGDFVRSLARSLVLDDNIAADISQKTWLATIQHPPTENRPLRTWLTRVVRNFVRKEHRGENRRRKHEKEVASPQGVPSTEEVVAREEVRRRVVEAVFRLKNPYRSTILLRYFENLPPLEIAKRFNIPVETVKTRLKRGLKQLRAILDSENGGDRKAWCLMLAPLAGLTVASSATAAAATALPTAATTAATVSSKIKLCFASALLVGTTVALWHFLPGLDDNGISRSQTGEISSETAMEDPSRDDSGLLDKEINFLDMEIKSPARELHGFGGPHIAGRVTDKVTGEPITAFDLLLTRTPKQPPAWNKDPTSNAGGRFNGPEQVVHETIRDEQGKFRFLLEKGGPYWLRIGSSRYAANILTIEVDESTGLSDLRIGLDPGTTLSGRVVDNETGHPVAGALVAPCHFGWYDLTKLWHGFDEYEVHAKTDETGRFSLSGVPGWQLMIAAIHPDYAEEMVKTGSGENREVEIRLEKGFRISGIAWNDQGEPLAGLLVSMRSKEIPIARTVVTSADGSYTTPPARTGILSLIAHPPPGETEKSFSFTVETRRIQVIDRDMRVDFGLSANQNKYIAWHGFLYGDDGSPVPGARVTASYPVSDRTGVFGWDMVQPDWGSFLHDWVSLGDRGPRTATSNAQGRFELNKLVPGRYKIDLVLPGTGGNTEWGYITFDTFGNVERDLHLSGRGICGTAICDHTGMPITGKEGIISIRKQTPPHESFSSRIDEEGCFRLHGVDPGLYSLHAAVPGFPEKQIKGITITEEMKSENLRILIPQGGELRLICTAFTDPVKRGFNLSFRRRNRQEGIRPPRTKWHWVKPDGTLETTCWIESGEWIALLHFPWSGLIEREFEVSRGETTEVVISGNELLFHEGSVALSGTVCRSDGTPVPGVKLEFIKEEVPGFNKKQDNFPGTSSDSTGRFTVDGLEPGQWLVVAATDDGMKTRFPDLFISSQATDHVTFDLVLPDGKVSGTFFDMHTGHPLRGEGLEWRVFLHDATNDQPTCELSSTSGEGIFTLTGVPSGRFRLDAVALGYQQYFSQPFDLAEDQILDLGKIGLYPDGILDLVVENPSGKPISCYRVTCPGSGRQPHFQGRDSSGRSIFDRLPLGPVTILVSAQGFEDQKIPAFLEPGRPLELKIIMTPK